ncbi:elongin-A3-like [Mesocricetus auratus]|uniref:Elongin-A3-like n=1 Tax=Mesocricetus auratus TaxID=10036 RepID=A0ABM2WGP7_MESAU|nr:elongin-A3-like [Mesocricetus auratus]
MATGLTGSSESERFGETLREIHVYSLQKEGKVRAACSPSAEPAGRRRQRRRGSFWDSQPGSESQVRAAKPQGIVREPRRLPGLPPVCSKAEAVPAKPKPKPQSLSPLRAKTPGPWIQEGYPEGSFEDCLNYDSSLSSSSTLPPRKRQRTNNCEAQAQSPAAAKVPQSKAQSCKDLNLLLAASPFPEVTYTLQDCFPQEGPEHSSFTNGQEEAPWAWRSSSKTPVYSGHRPARPLPQNSHQGCLAKPHSWWETQGQPAPREDTQLWSQQKGESGTQIHTDKQTHSQTEPQAHLRQQDSLDLKLQALSACILNSEAKKPQGRQTKMIFHAQATSPGQHADLGPGAEAAPKNVHSFNEASGPGLLCRAPPLPLGCSHKTLAKKPAPLMAKAFKDYKNRWSRK